MANKEQILQYMLKLIAAKDEKLAAKTMEAFEGEISKSSVYNYLAELCEGGIINKADSGYELSEKSYLFTYDNTAHLEEDRVFSSDIEPLLSDLSKNVLSAWRYAFTEMMNNAIEHSSATLITVSVLRNAVKTAIIIGDNGKGIFENIRQFMLSERGEDMSYAECATLLFAGKFTTAKSMHSGEGIFFTSHLMDSFRIISDGVVFSRDNFTDFNYEKLTPAEQSTTVIMELDNSTKKTTREVFDRFSSVDDGFIKTQIPIAHIFPGAGPVSRSEARRLGSLIESFQEVELDFTNVEELGQAFVHELFIVWQRNNPDVRLNATGASGDADFMIRRVLNSK
ncbi:MAG: DUF4325 domain-containing protein [Clostridia bacterium]|nr:DUF4325 domain-containing protein [Clostridia bacterium]